MAKFGTENDYLDYRKKILVFCAVREAVIVAEKDLDKARASLAKAVSALTEENLETQIAEVRSAQETLISTTQALEKSQEKMSEAKKKIPKYPVVSPKIIRPNGFQRTDFVSIARSAERVEFKEHAFQRYKR